MTFFEQHGAEWVETTLLNHFLDGWAILVCRAELNQGIGPQGPLVEPVSYELGNPRIGNSKEALDVAAVVFDNAIT